MSIWNHLPVYAVVAGPMRAREAVEADRHRVSEATWQRLEQMREQMQFIAKPRAYPFPGAHNEVCAAPPRGAWSWLPFF